MGNSLTVRTGCAAGLATLILSFAPTLQAKEHREADQLQALRACSDIEEDAARLTCFDQSVQTLVDLQDRGEITVVDREDIAETRRGLFGFSLPKLGVFGPGDDSEEQVLNSRITAIRQIRSDHWEIEIAEGSVWLATNTPRRFKPKVGSEVELEQAALSSYWFRVDGQLGVKARRIR